MTDKLVERALVRFVADCSDEEQQLPALQFICNRSPFIAEAITKALASSSVPEQDEEEETYRLGKDEGFAEAVQRIDLLTGGDGEYRYCTNGDPERHCPDPETMIANIVARFPPPPAPQDRGASQEDDLTRQALEQGSAAADAQPSEPRS